MTDILDLSREGRDLPKRQIRVPAFLLRPTGVAGIFLVTMLVLLATLSPLLFPQGPDAQSSDTLLLPSLAHPFGTDELGRDVLVRSLYGLAADLSIVFVAIPASAVIGGLMGLSGAIRPWIGDLAQTIFSIILGFPGIILAISVAVVFSPGWEALVVALTLYGIPAFGRLARMTLMTEMDRDYVMAARLIGVPKTVIVLRHILPSAMAPMAIQAALFAVAAIFLEAGLSIVGLGLQPPTPSLGMLLNNGARYMGDQYAYVLGPSMILLALTLGLNMLADTFTEPAKHDRDA